MLHTDHFPPTVAAMTAALADRLPEFGQIDWLATTGSTNADLLARLRAGEGAARPWLLGAWRQVSGRGRAGRAWNNEAGAALMFSCAFDVDLPMARLPALSPVSGIVACEALRRLAGPRAGALRMKWPNDLQLGAGKLVGILVETARCPDRKTPVVVMGMGLNLRHAAQLSAQLGREIADWSQVRGQEIADGGELAEIAATVAQAWREAVELYQRADYAPFVARHAQVDALAGSEVNVIEEGRIVFSGAALGTDGQGRLQVAAPQGTVAVSVGEISVRPR